MRPSGIPPVFELFTYHKGLMACFVCRVTLVVNDGIGVSGNTLSTYKVHGERNTVLRGKLSTY